MAKPRYIDSPEQLWDYFLHYKKWAIDNPIKVHDFVGKDAKEAYRLKNRPLTLEGFENWLEDEGVIKDLENYINTTSKGFFTEYAEVATRIRKRCLDHNLNHAAVGEYQQNIIARYHGLANQVVNTNVEQPFFPDELDNSNNASE